MRKEMKSRINLHGYPRISCTRDQAAATCAAFIEESRMKVINANKFHRKSGVWGTRRFYAWTELENGIRLSHLSVCGWDRVCG
jgi:hypothetical protein